MGIAASPACLRGNRRRRAPRSIVSSVARDLPAQDVRSRRCECGHLFVISGFVMYCATARTPQRLHDFLVKRAIRVLPMYWLVTLAVTGAVWCVPAAFVHFRVTGEQLVKVALVRPVLRRHERRDSTRDSGRMDPSLRTTVLRAGRVHAPVRKNARCARRRNDRLCRCRRLLGARIAATIHSVAVARLHHGGVRSRSVAGPRTADHAHSRHPTWVRIIFCCLLFTFGIYQIASVTPYGVGLDRLVYRGLGGLSVATSLALLEPELKSARRFAVI